MSALVLAGNRAAQAAAVRTEYSPDFDGPASAHDAPDEAAPGAKLILFSGAGLALMAAGLGVGAWNGLPLVSLFCALVLALGLVCRAWAALSLLALGYERTLSAWRAFPGDTVTLTLTLDNRKPLPLAWVRAEEMLMRAVAPAGQALHRTRHAALVRVGFGTPLSWYQAATWTCELQCRRRGWFPIGPARLASGDLFGLYANGRDVAPLEPLIVYPRLYDLADLGLPATHPLGDARDPARLFEDASRSMGLREYTPQTPFKNIAWHASARHGQLYAKTFEPTVTLQTAIFLAADRFTPEDGRASYELAISTVASLAKWLIDRRQAAGVYSNGAMVGGNDPGLPVVVGPGRGDEQLRNILDSLARLRRRAVLPLHEFLRARAGAVAGRTTVCVVAPRLSDADLDVLAGLRQRGCGVLALIVGSGAMPEERIPCRRINGTLLGDFRS